MGSIVEKRDRLLNQIQDQSGVESVGICKRDGDLSLLVLVHDDFTDLGFSTFEDLPVVVEIASEGEAYTYFEKEIECY
jgi:hypothetical protein